MTDIMTTQRTRRWLVALALACGGWLVSPAAQVPAQTPALAPVPPVAADSVKFAVMGDNGTGDPPQYAVGKQMAMSHATFPFTFVIMLGDNMYGSQRPQDFVTKFESPYKALIDAKVDFYASLGNHDDTNQRLYTPFNMGGKRYYTYRKGSNIRFFVLDSNYMDPPQVTWFENELKNSGSDWKIVYFHHPLYSSGMHGSQTDLRAVLEPLMVKYGVAAVFSGHEHFYQRIKPQKGITYFVSGAGGQLRKGDLQAAPMTAAGFDTDQSFMLVEIAGKALNFQAISRLGKVVDKGAVAMPDAAKSPVAGGGR